VDQRRSTSVQSATTLTARSPRNLSTSSSSSDRVAPVRPAPRATRTSSRAKLDAWAVSPSGAANRSNSCSMSAADTARSWWRTRPVTCRTRVSASTPRSPASVRQRPYRVSADSCAFGLRVACTAHLTSRGVRSRPEASSRSTSRSIWSVRLENRRTSSSGRPWSSRLPCRSAAVHSTPSVLDSSRW
jgi:hypothetical protein